MASWSKLRLLAGAVLSGTLVAGCPSGGAAPPAGAAAGAAPVTSGRGPLAVSVVAARREAVERSVAVLGTLHGDEEATLSNKVTGRVQKIAADVGDVVASGTELAVLELEDLTLARTITERSLDHVLARLGVDRVPDDSFDADRVATVMRAKAELQNARNKWDRMKDQKQGIVSEQTLKDTETAVRVCEANLEAERLAGRALAAEARQSEAQLALARLRLQDAHVLAPQGARRWSVSERFVSEGEFLKEGTPLFRVVACDQLRLRAAVPERYTADLRVGQGARVTIEAYPGRAFEGAISRVNPTVDPANRTFGVEVLLPNRDGQLRPGAFARAVVVTGTEDVTLVPLDAIVSFAGVTKVFVVEGDRARERIVVPGARHGAVLEVTGVEKGARVVVRGQTVATDGALVAVTEAPAGAPGPGEGAPPRTAKAGAP